MELALGDGYSLTLRKVQKNNSLILDGLCIEKDGSPVASSIYLNPFMSIIWTAFLWKRSPKSS